MDGSSQDETGDTLAYAMKLIIIPLLSRSFELRQHEVVGEAAVETMVKDMFDPIEDVQGTSPSKDCHYRVKHTQRVNLLSLPTILKCRASCVTLVKQFQDVNNLRHQNVSSSQAF